MNTYNFLFIISLLIACSYTLRTSKTNAKAEEHLSAEIEEQMEAQTETATKTQAQKMCTNWYPPMNVYKTTQKSTRSGYPAVLAVLNSENGKDAFKGYKKFTHTNKHFLNWWRTFLDEPMVIKRVEILNRVDCCGSRLGDVMVYVDSQLCGRIPHRTTKNTWYTVNCNIKGQKISLVNPRDDYLSISGIVVTAGPRKICTKKEIEAEK